MLRKFIERNNDAPRKGRAFVEEVLSEFPESVEDAALVVSELLTNAVIHDPDQAMGGEPIELSIDMFDDTARITVASETRGRFDIRARRRGAPGGYGLAIVNALALQWGIRKKPITAIWCDLPLVRRPPEPAATC